jgi:hypothetical protein
MIVNSKSASALLLATLTCMLSGCGGADIPELGEVSGVVTMNGEPIVGIDVVAYPKEGRPAYGLTDENGAYVIMYKNGIAGTKAGPTRITPMYVQGGKAVPKEYSEMMFDVKPGEETIVNFDMKSNAPEWATDPAKAAKAKKPKRPVLID